MKAEHTKGLLERNAIKGWELWIGADYHIADVHGQLDIRRANALRMITCWNSHDKLLEACKAFLAATLDARTDKRGCTCSRCLDAQGELEAAIVLAEKENG